MKSFSENTRSGFTLLEIVLTLSIMSFVGMVYVSHTGLNTSLPDTRVRLGEMRAFVLSRVAHAQNEALFNGKGCLLTFGKSALTTTAHAGVKCSLLEGEGATAAYPEGVTLSADSVSVTIDSDGIISHPPMLTFISGGASETVRLTTGVASGADQGS